jgi:NADH:ubiquinone reductase (H+-translocating)
MADHASPAPATPAGATPGAAPDPGTGSAPPGPPPGHHPAPHRVVIVGGGFAGLHAARDLGAAGEVDVTLVDRRNFHLFQPLLYQVATGALSPGEIAQPLRSILRRQRNTRVLLGEAVALDPVRREVVLSDGGPIPYDTLVVATGARHAYFGNDHWAVHAPGLKTLDDATEIRRRILIAFEAAEREADPDRLAEWMTFIVVGGGPTGVELAGALGEIANDTLRHDFRAIRPSDARIVLIEAQDRVLPMYPADRSASARVQLERLGVRVRTGTVVNSIDEQCVMVRTGEQEERIPARTVLWAAGVLASSFARTVADVTGAETDRSGRLLVGPDLTVPGHPEIFVVGDAALQPWRGGRFVPGVAQGAIQPGRYVARTILRRLRGQPVKPFRFRDRGDVAVIGRLSGVTNIGWLGPFGRQGGFTAWLLWLVIHIFYLIGFANRIVVVVRWAWSFLTRGRSTRLITGSPLLPPIEDPDPPAQGSGG